MAEGEWENDGTEIEEVISDDEGSNATITEGEEDSDDEVGGTQIAPQDTEMEEEVVRMMDQEAADDPGAGPRGGPAEPSGRNGGGGSRAAEPADEDEQAPPTQIDSPHADSQATKDRPATAADPSEQRRAPSPLRRNGQGSGVSLSGGVVTAANGGSSSGFLSSAAPSAKASRARAASSLSSPQRVPQGWLDDQLDAAAAAAAPTEGASATPPNRVRRQHTTKGNGGSAPTHAGAAPVARALPKKPSPAKTAVAVSGGWIRTKGSPSKARHPRTAVAEGERAGAPDTQEGSVAQSILAIGVPLERRVAAPPRPRSRDAIAVGVVRGTVNSQELRPNEFSQIRKGCSQQDYDFERMMDAEIAAAAASGQDCEHAGEGGGYETDELPSPPHRRRNGGGDVVTSERKKMRSSAHALAVGGGSGSSIRASRGSGSGKGAIGSRTPGAYMRRPPIKSSTKKRTHAPSTFACVPAMIATSQDEHGGELLVYAGTVAPLGVVTSSSASLDSCSSFSLHFENRIRPRSLYQRTTLASERGPLVWHTCLLHRPDSVVERASTVFDIRSEDDSSDADSGNQAVAGLTKPRAGRERPFDGASARELGSEEDCAVIDALNLHGDDDDDDVDQGGQVATRNPRAGANGNQAGRVSDASPSALTYRDLSDFLDDDGWKCVDGKGLHTWFYLLPGRKGRAGTYGVDYLVSEAEVAQYVRGDEQTLARYQAHRRETAARVAAEGRGSNGEDAGAGRRRGASDSSRAPPGRGMSKGAGATVAGSGTEKGPGARSRAGHTISPAPPQQQTVGSNSRQGVGPATGPPQAEKPAAQERRSRGSAGADQDAAAEAGALAGTGKGPRSAPGRRRAGCDKVQGSDRAGGRRQAVARKDAREELYSEDKWREVWPKLREKGWHWVYGLEGSIYLKEGVTKKTGTVGVDMFLSKTSLLDFVARSSPEAATPPPEETPAPENKEPPAGNGESEPQQLQEWNMVKHRAPRRKVQRTFPGDTPPPLTPPLEVEVMSLPGRGAGRSAGSSAGARERVDEQSAGRGSGGPVAPRALEGTKRVQGHPPKRSRVETAPKTAAKRGRVGGVKQPSRGGRGRGGGERTREVEDGEGRRINAGPFSDLAVIVTGLRGEPRKELVATITKLGGEEVVVFGKESCGDAWKKWLLDRSRQRADADGNREAEANICSRTSDGGSEAVATPRARSSIPPRRLIAVATPDSDRTPKFQLAMAAGVPIVHPSYVAACASIATEVKTDGYLLPLGRSALGDRGLVMPSRSGRDRPFQGKAIMLCMDGADDDRTSLGNWVLTLTVAGATTAINLIEEGDIFCVIGPKVTNGRQRMGTPAGSLEWAVQCIAHGRLLLPNARTCPWFPLDAAGTLRADSSARPGSGDKKVRGRGGGRRGGGRKGSAKRGASSGEKAGSFSFHVHTSGGKRYVAGDYVFLEKRK
ncbi:unnamed protein product, partial [Scytosiphon promiscuus]